MATVTFKNDIVCNLGGTEINVGDTAPVVTVVNCNPMLQNETVGGAQDNVQLVVVVPSLDTPVCDAETRRFNVDAASLEGVTVTTVSMDLPFAAKRFCSTKGIENLSVLSDFRDKAFSTAYGTLIAEGPLRGLSARVVFVIAKDGTIAYKEITDDIVIDRQKLASEGIIMIVAQVDKQNKKLLSRPRVTTYGIIGVKVWIFKGEV